jgi:ribonuclease HI
MEIYIDGAVRRHQFGAGKRAGKIAIVIDGEELVEDVGSVTNNQAEYLALIKALEVMRKRGIEDARIYCDSELLVKQFKGEYRVRNPNLKPYYRRAKRLAEGLKFTLTWVPREHNLAGKLLEE